MSYTYQTKEDCAMALFGRFVQYQKSGARKGWVGEIRKVTRDPTMPGGFKIEVHYDNGVVQPYCIEAVEGFGRPVRIEESAGYLKLLDRAVDEPVNNDLPVFFIIDTRGTCHGSGNDYDYLCVKAKSIASRNPPGMRLFVCRAVSMFRKEPMPVNEYKMP